MTDRRVPVREFAMRPALRRTVIWLPIGWLLAVLVAMVDSIVRDGGAGLLFWTFFLLYGIAFVWLSRFQVLTVRLRADGTVEFVAPARVIAIRLDDLVEVAPARGMFQHRFATRFRTNTVRVTVLSRAFPEFGALVEEVERRSKARIVRY